MLSGERHLTKSYLKTLCLRKFMGNKFIILLLAGICCVCLLINAPREPHVIELSISEMPPFDDIPSWEPLPPENQTSPTPEFQTCNFHYLDSGLRSYVNEYNPLCPSKYAVHPPVFPGKPTNLTNIPCPEYLPNFRSPCWWEELKTSDPYLYNPIRTNFLLPNKNIPVAFANLTKQWKKQFTFGRRYRLRCFPSVYLAGVLKSGTSALWYQLIKHPDIKPALVKEPHWWSHYWGSRKQKYIAGQNMSNYLDMFDKASLEIQSKYVPNGDCEAPFYPGVIMDASAWTLSGDFKWRFYAENKDLPEPSVLSHHFIRKLTPGAKIIVILRNPTDRLYSEYLYLRRNDEIKPNAERFHEYVMNRSRDFLNDSNCHPHIGVSCLYKYAGFLTSVYHPFLREWMSVIPRNQFLIIHYEEEFSKDPLTTVQRVVDFLGLDPLPESVAQDINTDQKINANKHKLPMFNITKTFLDDFYRPHNEYLAQFLQDDRFAWR